MKFVFFLKKKRSNNLTIAPHCHNCHEITFYRGGMGRVEYAPPPSDQRRINEQLIWVKSDFVPERNFDFKQLTCFYVPPYTIHNERHFAPEMDLVSIGFELSESDPPFDRTALVSDKDGFIADKINNIEREFTDRPRFFAENINAYLSLIYNRILQSQYNGSNAPAQEGTDFDYIINYFNEYFMTAIDIESVAATMGYCADHFRLLFKKKMGVSPKQYIIQMRLKYAHALICGTDLPLKQIAEQCGYNDYFQFNAIFKKYYGVSPISFREKISP